MKKCVPFFFGLIPLALGWLLNYLMNVSSLFSGITGLIIAIALLFFWGLLAYETNRMDRSSFTHAFKMNFIGLIMLVLVLIQELVLGSYWPNFIGVSSQFYFLPCLSVAFRIEGLFSLFFSLMQIWFSYALVYVLMFAVSYIGSRLRRR